MTAVRLATPADAAGVLAIYRSVVTDSHASFEIDVPTESEMAARIDTTLSKRPWLVAELDGKVRGYAYATNLRARPAYRWSCEVSVYVAQTVRGRGMATLLYRALFRLLLRQGYRMAFAAIALPNPASVALHERLGFRRAGSLPAAGFKHGAWIDVGFWSLQLQPLSRKPDEPCTLDALDPSELVALIQ